MKKKLITVLGMALCIGLLAAGCGKKEEEKKEEKKEPEKKVEVQEKEEVVRIIGEETEGAYGVVVTNSVGQDIQGISVKSSLAENWSENILKEGEQIKNGEKVKFFFDPSSVSATTAVPETDFAVRETWDVNLTIADGTTYKLTGFAFEDIEEGVLKLEDGVAFVEYTSKESKETVSTKEQELGLKAAAEALLC